MCGRGLLRAAAAPLGSQCVYGVLFAHDASRDSAAEAKASLHVTFAEQLMRTRLAGRKKRSKKRYSLKGS